jgi:hypothetical protein
VMAPDAAIKVALEGPVISEGWHEIANVWQILARPLRPSGTTRSEPEMENPLDLRTKLVMRVAWRCVNRRSTRIGDGSVAA